MVAPAGEQLGQVGAAQLRGPHAGPDQRLDRPGRLLVHAPRAAQALDLVGRLVQPGGGEQRPGVDQLDRRRERRERQPHRHRVVVDRPPGPGPPPSRSSSRPPWPGRRPRSPGRRPRGRWSAGSSSGALSGYGVNRWGTGSSARTTATGAAGEGAARVGGRRVGARGVEDPAGGQGARRRRRPARPSPPAAWPCRSARIRTRSSANGRSPVAPRHNEATLARRGGQDRQPSIRAAARPPGRRRRRPPDRVPPGAGRLPAGGGRRPGQRRRSSACCPAAFGPDADWYAASPRGPGPAPHRPPAVVGRPGRATPATSPPPCSPASCTSASTSSASTSASSTRAWASPSSTSRTRDERPAPAGRSTATAREQFEPLRRPPRARGRHPHAHARGGDRRARPRRRDPRLQGRAAARATCSARSRASPSDGRAVGPVARHLRHRQRLRLRPGVGPLPRAEGAGRLPLGLDRVGQPRVALQLHATTTSATSAEGQHALAKSLFLGGVTRRFPELRFAFLEGGVAWAASLYADLVGHWEKRNGERHGPPRPARHRPRPARRAGRGARPEGRTSTRRSAPCRRRTEDPATARRVRGLRHRAGRGHRATCSPRPFFFGCEADDPLVRTAFDTAANPFGARLQAVFGSDIAHWDVPDMAEVLDEAYELVEHGLIDEADFRDFVFTNPVRFFTDVNPRFFEGTVVADAVRGAAAPGRDDARPRPPGRRRSSTAPARPAAPPTSASRGRPHRRRRRPVDERRRRPTLDVDGPGRGPRLRRPPHPLRRPAPVGPGGHARRRSTASPRCSAATAASPSPRWRPGDADYIRQMMAVVEGMPLDVARGRAGAGTGDASASGSTASTAAVAVNAGFLVGHSTVRRAVMGDAAVTDAATPEQVEAMVAEVHRADRGRRARLLVVAGARPTATATATTCRRWPPPATSWSPSPPPPATTTARRSSSSPAWARSPRTAWRSWPTWPPPPAARSTGTCSGSLSPVEIYEQQLAASDVAAERGAEVVALALPDVMRLRMGPVLDALPGVRRRRPRSRSTSAAGRWPTPTRGPRCGPRPSGP